jgi:hypothetical protein
MIKTVARLDRVSEFLDEILLLPLGHPDRLRLLICAERVFEDPASGPALELEIRDARSALSEARP